MSNEYFDGNTVRKINNMYGRGKPVTGLWRDTKCQGLAISVGVRGPVWHMKTRDCNARIADFESFQTIDEIQLLREAVEFARTISEGGRKLDEFFNILEDKKDLVAAKAWHGVVTGETLNWEAARDRYLQWCRENRREATWEGYRSALAAVRNSKLASDFEPIAGKPLVSIEPGDLDTVRNNIVARCKRRAMKLIVDAAKSGKVIDATNQFGLRQANLTVAALRACFKHFKMHPEIYGLKINPALGLENTADRPPNNTLEADSGESASAMTQYELGAYQYALMQVKNPITRAGLWLQLKTGQRRFTSASAIRSSFRQNEHYGVVWRLKDKVHHWRLLPLSAETAAVVQGAIKEFEGYNNKYLLPIAKKRLHPTDKEGHINKRTLSAAIEKMRDTVFLGWENPPSSHDLRYAFITRMGNEMHRFQLDGRRLQFKDIEIVTHANEGREGTASMIYDKSPALDIKAVLLQEWEDYLAEGYRMYCEGLQNPEKREEYKRRGSAEAQRKTTGLHLVVENESLENVRTTTSKTCFACSDPFTSTLPKQRICGRCLQHEQMVCR